MRRARLLAVVGRHVNTFKPFICARKTSVLFVQNGEAKRATYYRCRCYDLVELGRNEHRRTISIAPLLAPVPRNRSSAVAEHPAIIDWWISSIVSISLNP